VLKREFGFYCIDLPLHSKIVKQEFIFVAGAALDDGKLYEGIQRYDTESQEWTHLAPMPIIRDNCSICTVGGKDLYVAFY
jgi:hypothetical protein